MMKIKMTLIDPPTVDAVAHGRWKCISVGRYACSLCGFEPWYEGSINTLHYCSHCGARMDAPTVEAPEVDAVPVIRCKDCKYGSPNRVYGCRINSFADDLNKRMYSDDFCSRAERREE